MPRGRSMDEKAQSQANIELRDYEKRRTIQIGIVQKSINN